MGLVGHVRLGAAKAGGGGRLLYATNVRVTILDRSGSPAEHFAVPHGVVALTQVRDRIVLGFRDGGIEIARRGKAHTGRRRRATGANSAFTFQSTPSSPVTLLRPGPRGTLLAGYANGQYGLWSWPGGNLLLSRRLHGPVTAALRSGPVLHVATSLGQHDSLDLAVFERPHCQQMRQIWRQVPVGWSQGRPVRRTAPPKHHCLPSAPSQSAAD